MGVTADGQIHLGKPGQVRARKRAERSRSECDDVAPSRPRPYIGTMHLDLSDEEAAALTKELADITGNDRNDGSVPVCRKRHGIALRCDAYDACAD
jgi:hypothetical protein